MKSLMEEATSVAKAIEAAWQRAGNPAEFSVKVLELPQTGFLGLKTVKSAKIALYFSDKAPAVQAKPGSRFTKPSAQRAPESAEGQPHTRATGHEQSRERFNRSEGRPDGRYKRHDGRQGQRQDERRGPRPDYRERGPEQPWNDEMLQTAHEWVKDALSAMGHSAMPTNAHISHNYLKIRLNDHIENDPQQEEMLLKSWGSLAMGAVREKAQQPLRHLRVVVEIKR